MDPSQLMSMLSNGNVSEQVQSMLQAFDPQTTGKNEMIEEISKLFQSGPLSEENTQNFNPENKEEEKAATLEDIRRVLNDYKEFSRANGGPEIDDFGFTEDENKDLDIIKNKGFDIDQARNAYVSCDRKLNDAIYLLETGDIDGHP